MYKKIHKCRICGNGKLLPIINLGTQNLTGVFPKSKEQYVARGPLELVKCEEKGDGLTCGLVQLLHSYDLELMYGTNYGYRSGLNPSMVAHLHGKVKKIFQDFISLKDGDLILDIGSNDSTLLQAYPHNKNSENGKELKLVGIDPTGVKFKEFYPQHITLIPDFFPTKKLAELFGAGANSKAKIITSISMFYDLEDPLSFVKSIHETLDDEGIWVFEQSYLPAMLETNSYDTICHEHLEYYALKQIKWLLDRAGLMIVDVEFNSINGGSFSVTAAKNTSTLFKKNKELIKAVLEKENTLGLHSKDAYQLFQNSIISHKEKMLGFLQRAKAEGKKVLGYGASTKGNVILQYCGINEQLLSAIAEVNSDKFGSFTPGTLIPIISEEAAKNQRPYYFLVFPWHFEEFIMKKEEKFLKDGGHLVFPLPNLKIV